jgi:hypothetical protein
MNWKYVRSGPVSVYSPSTVGIEVGKVWAMIARIFLGLLGFIVALLMMRLFVDETRRARVAVRNDRSQRSMKEIGRLEQDPATGVYYPAD